MKTIRPATSLLGSDLCTVLKTIVLVLRPRKRKLETRIKYYLWHSRSPLQKLGFRVSGTGNNYCGHIIYHEYTHVVYLRVSGKGIIKKQALRVIPQGHVILTVVVVVPLGIIQNCGCG